MEKILLELGLMFLTAVVLAFASQHDIKHHEIELSTILYVVFLGFIFFIAGDADITSLIYAEVIITMIFLIPAIFGMGFGDMLLFWGLGFFFTEQIYLHMFLAGFFISAVIITVYYVDKYGIWINKNRLRSIEFPLVPTIFTGFVFFIIYFLIPLM